MCQERFINKISVKNVLIGLTDLFIVGCATVFLTGCATMMGDRTVNVTGDQIAKKLNEKLALPIQLLKVDRKSVV